jgi:RNA polymerase sigma-70 factor, ECF subfamily
MPFDAELFESYRPLLFSIAYRMLGSAMEAEDMVQETYLRANRANAQEIDTPKAYLSKIITRLCLDQLKSAKSQRETYIGTWLPEPISTEAPSLMADQHEAISIAFLALLENLSPVERAIFLLRDVFDHSYSEIAEIVGKREDNCRRYYRHAKQFLTENRPRFAPAVEEQQRLVTQFLNVLATGDLEGLTALLAEDVILYGDGGGKAPAIKQPLVGREAVLRLLVGSARLLQTHDIYIEMREINGAAALLFWEGDKLHFVMNITVQDNHIVLLHNVLNPDKLRGLRRGDRETGDPEYRGEPDT